MTIHELSYEIKRLRERLESREVYTILLFIVVGFASFGLGRLSKLQDARVPVRIEQTFSPQTASAASSVNSQKLTVSGSSRTEVPPLSGGGKVVASRGGSKYHYPWCSGAQRISDANKVWFNSVEEARKAGYTPASNCKGLK